MPPAGRVAESISAAVKASGYRLPLEHEAVAQDQRVVLVGLDDLLAAPLAAHDDQAAVGAQRLRREQVPERRTKTAALSSPTSPAMTHPHPVTVQHRIRPSICRAAAPSSATSPACAARAIRCEWLATKATGRAGSARPPPSSPRRTTTMDAMAQHQQHRVVELVVHRHRPRPKVATSRTARSLGGSGRSSASLRSVWQDAEAVAIAHKRVAHAPPRQLPAEADDVGAAVDEERLAHEDVADPRRHQRHELAPLARGGLGPPRLTCPSPVRRCLHRFLGPGSPGPGSGIAPVASVRGRLGRADAGFDRTCCAGSRPGRPGARALVEHREQPDPEEAQRHREHREVYGNGAEPSGLPSAPIPTATAPSAPPRRSARGSRR